MNRLLSSLWVKIGIIFLLFIIGVILGYEVIQNFFKLQEADALVINIAGRQRMLIQKMSKEAVEVVYKKDEKQRSELKATVELFDGSLHDLMSGNEQLGIPATTDQEILEKLQNIKKLWDPFHQNIEVIINGQNDLHSIDKISSSNIQLLNLADEAVKMYEINARQRVEKISRYLSIGSIAFVLFGIFSWLFMTIMITRPLQKISNTANQIADGNLRLHKLQIRRKDEIGLLASSVDQMLENLQYLMNQMTQSVSAASQTLVASSEELSAVTDESAKSSKRILVQLEEVVRGSETYEKGAEETDKAMEEISAGILNIAERADDITKISLTTASAAERGNDWIQNTIGQMNSIDHSVNELTMMIKQLGIRSNEIGQIVEMITTIASQTNLLALNAAIEAARAGENGRGFAVVANEVRKLAEQSEESTAKIIDIVQEIQKETYISEEKMNHVNGEVQKGLDTIQEAGKAFEKILNGIHQVTDQIQEITYHFQSMSASSEEVTAFTIEMNGTAKEATKHVKQIASDLKEQLNSIEEIAKSTESLSKMAEDLNELIGKIKV